MVARRQSRFELPGPDPEQLEDFAGGDERVGDLSPVGERDAGNNPFIQLGDQCGAAERQR